MITVTRAWARVMPDCKVAFQGEHGAYSEQAVVAHFGERAETVPCRVLKDVFRSVENRIADFGIVPVENSTEGTVTQTYDLLLTSALKTCGETKIRISHCLLARPEARLEDIRVVYSHPQALAQCASFIEQRGYDVEGVYDTAGGARIVRDSGRSDTAAIASEKAAQIYGLAILRRKIENSTENFTRFLAIGPADPPPSGHDKTSIVFSTMHSPGALYKALGELASRRINLTKIESRPIKGTPWEYHFFVDFEGHHDDPSCSEALQSLATSTNYLKILGSYPQANSPADS